MRDFLDSLSLTNFGIIITLLVIVVAGLFLALRKLRLWWPSGIALIVTAVVTGIIAVIIEIVWKPFPDALPLRLYIAVGIAVWVVFLVFIGRGVRKLLLGVLVVSLVGVAAVANSFFKAYPSVGSFFPDRYAVGVDFAEFPSITNPPESYGNTVGALVTVALPGEKSGFAARDAVAYVPPAYWQQPNMNFPVLVLMAGNPGRPTDWSTSGNMAKAADAFQRENNGLSPIVVSVDATGSMTGNPVCTDSDVAKVQTYLTEDVPAGIMKAFRVKPDLRTWTIGGLSYGATCALQIVTNYPDLYGSFLDFSGQIEPTMGTRKATVDKFFGGDESAFVAENPADILRANESTKTFSGIEGKFVAGANDQEAIKALTELNTLATRAGMTTTFSTLPGGHDFGVWSRALEENFAWVAHRGGII
ncbi:MAG: alpha/beta hydrolase-fold protein [Corynebacterium sp.]|nr:alpha/beta hydrolase-fold protein [Corynebacterium sp.]